MSSTASSSAPSPALSGHPPATWLSPEQAMEYLDLSRTTFYRMLREQPDFPRPHYIRPRVPRWKRAAIDAWLEARVSEVGEYQPAEAEA